MADVIDINILPERSFCLRNVTRSPLGRGCQHIPYEALRRATFTVDMTESQRYGVDSVLSTKAMHQRFHGSLGRAVNRNRLRILRLNTRRARLAVRSISHDRRTDHNSSRLASKGKLDHRHCSGDVHGHDTTRIVGFDHETRYTARVKDQIWRR